MADNEIDWPPRPGHEWSARNTSLPPHLRGVLPAGYRPTPVVEPTGCPVCGRPPLSSAGWGPGEMLTHYRTHTTTTP